jgi:hypothetical protein
MTPPIPTFRFAINLVFDMAMDVAEIESLEDTLSVILGALEVEGRVHCDVTGNITQFPNRSAKPDWCWIESMMDNLRERARQ